MFSFDGRDERTGVLGTLQGETVIVGKADSWEAILEIMYAQLGRDPTQTAYITNTQQQVLEIHIQTQYHADMQQHTRSRCIGGVLLVLCLLSFMAATPGQGWIALGLFGLFGLFALLYLGLVRLNWSNEVEAGVVCALFLILTILLVAIRNPQEMPAVPQDPVDATLRSAPSQMDRIHPPQTSPW